jgi:Superinfection immunity protein
MLGSLGQETLLRSLATLIVLLCLYGFPSWLAWYRDHHNLAAIVLLNLLLGWTVIGWVAALIWAATSPPPKG